MLAKYSKQAKRIEITNYTSQLIYNNKFDKATNLLATTLVKDPTYQEYWDIFRKLIAKKQLEGIKEQVEDELYIGENMRYLEYLESFDVFLFYLNEEINSKLIKKI